MTAELWKPVVGFEGAYEVSNFGRVRSLDRPITQAGHKGTVYTKTVKGRLLRPGIASHGYPTVMLGRIGGTRTVHSLVADAFLGPCPPPGQEVRHKNGVRSDPRAANLHFGTRAQNNIDASLHDRRKVSRATVAFVKLANGTSTEIAEIAGISRSHAHNIKAGKQRVLA